MPGRRHDKFDTAAIIIFGLLLAAVVFGIRFWIAGGDIGCVFSADPALCIAVKGVGK